MAIQELEFRNHEEWLAIRSKYIGGSDAGAVIGMNPYKSAYTLWAEKTGKLDAFEGNVATKVGAFLEDFVAQMFEEETGKKVRRKNRTLVNDKYPFACANLDRVLVGEKAFLEIKTTTSIPIMKQLRKAEFPEAYYAQCMHYLAVTELPKCYLAVLVNCREFKVYELERDEDEINALMAAEKEFWGCVENKVAPAVDGSESTSESLSALFPEGVDGEVNLMAYDHQMEQYLEISKKIKELETLKTQQANIIKEFMQQSEKGKSAKFKASWTTTTKSTFDAKRFSADHPEVDISKYYNVTPSRRFTISKITK